MSNTVGEDFPREQERLRELLQIYKDIGPAGAFGLLMITDVARRAEVAAISGDIVQILRLYQEMKDCQ